MGLVGLESIHPTKVDTEVIGSPGQALGEKPKAGFSRASGDMGPWGRESKACSPSQGRGYRDTK